MGHVAAKVAADDAVPGGALPLVKLWGVGVSLCQSEGGTIPRCGAGAPTVFLIWWAMSCADEVGQHGCHPIGSTHSSPAVSLRYGPSQW
jgi:hypothetical protein